jgi:hypothetical protein
LLTWHRRLRRDHDRGGADELTPVKQYFRQGWSLAAASGRVTCPAVW